MSTGDLTPDIDDAYPIEQGQGEDDSDASGAAESFLAGLLGTDWTVETLVSQMRKGRIDLNPAFQRRNAWLDNRKSKLIESILLGFPVPQIVIAERRDEPGKFFVIDGKQRLLALRQFFASEGLPGDNDFDPLRLVALTVRKDLNGLTFADFGRQNPDMVSVVENFTIRTIIIRGWTSEEMLLSLFLRLNSGSVSLSPQELRQALVPGEFTSWLDETSGELAGLRRLLNLEHPDRRMVDAELLLRHLAFQLSPLKYQGNLKQFLDDSSRAFNSDWLTYKPQADRAVEDLNLAIDFGLSSFAGFGHKWSPKAKERGPRFERALNRAVLDFQFAAFSDAAVRAAVGEKSNEVEEAFKLACVGDVGFINAISLTTKTADAFRLRHSTWQGILRQNAGVDYPMPGPLDQR